jgi:hypothetical protein
MTITLYPVQIITPTGICYAKIKNQKLLRSPQPRYSNRYENLEETAHKFNTRINHKGKNTARYNTSEKGKLVNIKTKKNN